MFFIAVGAGMITDFQSWGTGNGEWGMEKTDFFKSVNKLMAKRYKVFFVLFDSIAQKQSIDSRLRALDPLNAVENWSIERQI